RADRPLAQHQGAARLLVRGVRRPRRARRAGGPHPGPPGLDAARGPRRPRAGRDGSGRRGDRERPLRGGHASARRDPGGARLPPPRAPPLRLRREPRPPCRHGRHVARLDAARDRDLPGGLPASSRAAGSRGARGCGRAGALSRQHARAGRARGRSHGAVGRAARRRRPAPRPRRGTRCAPARGGGGRLAGVRGRARIDFAGSAPQTRGPVNANLAVTRSAVLYVFTALAEEHVPPNDGLARPLTIVAPEGSIVNARFPAAVAGGNVETSQRIVDVLLRALAGAAPDRVPAASAGSMNNLALGGAGFAYYETLA